MKKKLGIICIAIAVIFSSSLTIAYAVNGGLTLYSTQGSSDEDVKLVYNIVSSDENLSISQKTIIIDSANKYSAILKNPTEYTNDTISMSTIPKTTISTNAKVICQYDNTINEKFYEIREKDFTVSIAEDTSLRSFTDSTFNYDLASTATDTVAREFILTVYTSLDLADEYELADLNKFGDNLWEAVLAQKIDGIFNYYDSINVYFCPMQRKIAALRVHSSEYHRSNLSSLSLSLTKQDAKDAVVEAFSDISLNDITTAELIFTKPNNFFTKAKDSELETVNTVVKAWKITIKKDYTYFVFVDSETGNIIGGDRIK